MVQSPYLRLLAGVLFGGAAVFLASREISLRDLPEAMRGVQVIWLVIALLTTFSGHIFKAFRWRILLQTEGFAVPFDLLLRYVLAGQLTNLFIPGRAGDIGRAWLVGARGAGRVFSFGTVVVEKVLDLIFYALLAAGLIIMIPLPGEVDLSPSALGFVAGAAVAGLLLGVRYWGLLTRIVHRLVSVFPPGQREQVISWTEAAGNSLFAFRNSGNSLRIVFSTGMIWVISWLTNEFVLQAFGLQLPLTASLLLLIVLQAGISTNIVPGTIGLFEYLCVIALARFNVSKEAALAYGLVLHVLVLLPLFGGSLMTIFSGDAMGKNGS